MTAAPMDHWTREIAEFKAHLAQAEGRNYRTWQPTKWQSLETVRDILVKECWGGEPEPGATALELGCGSATLLLQLEGAGIRGTGVDRDPGALLLANLSAKSMGIESPKLLDLDFFDEESVGQLERADLVFHIGVIEHFEPAQQLAFLRLSAQMSKRWVLVAVPNEHSPVFASFLRAVTEDERVYDDDHQDIDLPAVVDEAGFRLHRVDGAHVFFSSPHFYTPGSVELDAFYGALRPRLVSIGGPRYQEFPNMSFAPEDIPVLRQVEESLTQAERMRFGFLQYYLVDTSPSDVVVDSLVEAAIRDPHGAYSELRQRGSVVRDEQSSSWYVLDRKTVLSSLTDPRLRARGVPAAVDLLPDEELSIVKPVEQFFARWMAFSDPPKQTKVRRTVAPYLTRYSLRGHLDLLRGKARTILNDPSGLTDFVSDIALPLSRSTTMAILGTTEKETRKLEAHSEALIAYLAAPGTDVDRARLAATAIDGLRQLVEDLIDRADPLALSLFELTQSDSTISKDDVAAAYAQILTGSMEPLSVALTACVVRAAESGPIGEANVAEFIEETLTRIPPFHFAPRVAASDLVLEGKHINRGERVVLNLLSANDDGCPFVGSEEHLSFGAGTHYCLGAAAARAHLRAVLPPLLEAGVQQRVELAGVRRRSAFGASSFEAVPLRSVESPQQ